ncbi:MAG: family 43 glycosylhydrolase [Prevotella sp.]|nr:family 43 glycosylhydrolase [Prevotella sp.]
MKKIINILVAGAAAIILLPISYSCTDVGGDGIDSVLWEGSKNPENTSYRNPVWEPSLEAGTLLKGSSMYVALSATTQWTTGLTNYCPALTSGNLMTWSRANDGFNSDALPTWGEGRINSLSADYARLNRVQFFLFYTLEGSNSIGYAAASSGQGPYTDKGELLTAEELGVTSLQDPFFIVVATNYYLCYTTEEGTYIQKVTLRGNTVPAATVSLSGKPTKIASTGDVAVYRKAADDVYLFTTVKNGDKTEIRYGRASTITGPYLDKQGASLADGSTGELLIEGGSDIINPENPMRAFLNSEGNLLYVAYNATEAGNAQMKSGSARKPMFVSPVEFGEDGWFKASVTAQKGWTSPRFE